VRAFKTPYLRFDLNDYSITHGFVGRSLTLAASQARVRILRRPAARHRQKARRAVAKCAQPLRPGALAISLMLTDSVRGEIIRVEEEYSRTRIELMAMLGKARIPLQIDVGFGDASTPVSLEIIGLGASFSNIRSTSCLYSFSLIALFRLSLKARA
jgi:hypothetical protein